MFAPRLTLRLAAGALAATALLACVRRESDPTPSRAGDSAVATPLPSPEFSVYDLPSTWRDQRDTVRTLASLRGRPRALAMIYTHCTTTCPLIIGQLKRIEAATDAGIVLVSLDPARDTPGHLAAYAAEHGLDAARWTLLSGSDDAVRELAATLGVRYRRAGAGDLAHSNTITLLDATGAVMHEQPTLAGTDETIQLARMLSRRQPTRPLAVR